MKTKGLFLALLLSLSACAGTHPNPNPDNCAAAGDCRDLPDLSIVSVYAKGPYIFTQYQNIGGDKPGDFLIKVSADGQSFEGNPYYRDIVPPAYFEDPHVNHGRPTPLIVTSGGLTDGLVGYVPGHPTRVTVEIDWEHRVKQGSKGKKIVTVTLP